MFPAIHGVVAQILAATGGGGGGGLSVVASSSNKGAFAAVPVNVPVGTQDGDFMLAFVARRASSTLPNLATSGWTLLGSSTSGDTRSWAYTKTASSEPASYSIASGSHAAGAIVTIRPSLAPSVADSGMTSGTDEVAPSVDAAAAGDILVCFWADGSGTVNSITEDATMTPLETAGDTSLRICLAYEELAASGATGTRTATSDNTGDFDSWSVVVTEA